jgi:hypothetical protein
MSPPQPGDHADYAPTVTAGDGSSARSNYPERGGIDVFDSLLVRQPIAEEQTQTVRDIGRLGRR